MTLEEFFNAYPKVALGYSGGTDSSYLLHVGRFYNADVKPYFIKTPFQPWFELDDAKRLAKNEGIEMTVVALDVLEDETVASNPKNRCYYCKKALFSALKERAAEDGYHVLIDGTNASDDEDDRPGMLALKELGVLSPLRECGITKESVRKMSKGAGLFTWNKPSYSCLATRIPTDTPITMELLKKIDEAEMFLMNLGFTDLRVRLVGGDAHIQISADQMHDLVSQRERIMKKLSGSFDSVLLDFATR